MTLAEWMFAFVVLITVLCAGACWLCWRTAYTDGYTEGVADERAAAIASRSPVSTALLYDSHAPAAPAPGWDDEASEDEIGAWLASLHQEPVPAGKHHAPDNWTTTALTALPGGCYQPARPPADTGSFRAELVQRTDAFIAQITAGA